MHLQGRAWFGKWSFSVRTTCSTLSANTARPVLSLSAMNSNCAPAHSTACEMAQHFVKSLSENVKSAHRVRC